MVKQLYGKLHFGELEVIVAAKELNIPIAVIDERAARKMAAYFLIQTIGIIGVLSLAKQRYLIDYVKSEIDALRQSGYRISENLYKQILTRAMPWSPRRLASRWTARKMPVKYSRAGRMAFRATVA